MFPIFSVRRRQVAALTLLCWLATVCAGRAETYAQWAARVFTAAEQANPAVSGEDAAPAGDGVRNLLKFAFDLDPHRNGVAGLPTVGTVIAPNPATGQPEPFLAIRYRVPSTYAAEGITCVPEVSSDLRASAWYRGPDSLGDSGLQSPQSAAAPFLQTYRALSPMSQNPGGLFLRVRVVAGRQLPADWLRQYFGAAAVDPDADPDQDGLSNWQEFLQGTDPTDYYNAHLPELLLVGGGNQRAAAGSLLAQPVSVEVNYWGDQNAPLTFTATGGALLAPDASGAFAPSATISVRSTGQINVDGSQVYVAQAYVYLPGTVSALSTITASATTGGQTASVATTAVAADPNLAPPTGLNLVSNTATGALVGFTPADAARPVSLEVSQDGGITWATWAVADAGATTRTLADLPAETPLLVRAFTGVDGTAPPADTASATNSAGPAPGGTSPPGEPIGCTGYWQPHIVCRSLQSYDVNQSFKGFQTNTRYLKIVRHYSVHNLGAWTDQIEYYMNPNTVAFGDPLYTWLSGYHEGVYPYFGGGPVGVATQRTIDSDITAHGFNNGYSAAYPDPDTFTFTLSEPYPLEAFRTSAEGGFPAFPTTPFDYTPKSFDAYSNGAVLELTSFPALTADSGGVGYYTGYDLRYRISKVQYALLVNKEPGAKVAIDTFFVPADGSAPSHAVQVWDTQGATRSPVVLLDPVALHDRALGGYIVTVPQLCAYGHADDENYDGDLVPSNRTDGTGQKHFVTPRAAGGFVTVAARVTGYYALPSEPSFDQLYRFVVLRDGADVTASAATQAGQTLYVRTDQAAHHVVQLQTNDAAHTVLDTLHVWVVWADVTATCTRDSPFRGIVDGTNEKVTEVKANCAYEALIQPSSIFDTKADIPDLTKIPIPTPHHQAKHAMSGEELGNVPYRWDLTRQWREKTSAPTLRNGHDALFDPQGSLYGTIPTNRDGSVYTQTTSEDQDTDGYPKDAVEGNDDNGSEDGTPYSGRLGHLVNLDTPQSAVLDVPGSVGDKTEFRIQFRVFVRVNIGNVWYKISDLKFSRLHAKFVKIKKDGAEYWSADDSVAKSDNEEW